MYSVGRTERNVFLVPISSFADNTFSFAYLVLSSFVVLRTSFAAKDDQVIEYLIMIFL